MKIIEIEECSDEVITDYYVDWYWAHKSYYTGKKKPERRSKEIIRVVKDGKSLDFHETFEEMVKRGLRKEGEYQ